jgi:hypothetical protein
MKTRETTFERFEYKYWVTHDQLDKLMRMAAPFLRFDEWSAGGQQNTSLYLDSPEFEFAKLHLESALDRVKLRVRAYGNPPSGDAFFEIKRKVKDVIFKRRAIVPLMHMQHILSSLTIPRLQHLEEEQTLSQFLYLMMVHRAEPKVLVTCRRAAYTSADVSEGLRLTVDRDICYQPARDVSLSGDRRSWIRLCGVGSYQPDATLLVEIKFRGAAPLWIQEIVQRLGLRRCNFSKYVAAVSREEGAGLSGSDMIPINAATHDAKAA